MAGRTPVKLTIRRVSLSSLTKFGCLLGIVAAFLPSLLCGLLGLGLASLVARWLESWQVMTISLLGQKIATIDLVHLLNLEQVLETTRVLTSASASVLFLLVLVLAMSSGIVMAIIVTLIGLAYNLLAAASGGLAVEVARTGDQRQIR